MEEALRQVEEFIRQLPGLAEETLALLRDVPILVLLVGAAVATFLMFKLFQLVLHLLSWLAGVLVPGVRARRKRRAEQLESRTQVVGAHRPLMQEKPATTQHLERQTQAVGAHRPLMREKLAPTHEQKNEIAEARLPLTQNKSFAAKKQKQEEEAQRWYEEMQVVLKREEAARREREALRQQEMESRREEEQRQREEEERQQREELQRRWAKQQLELKRIEEERREKAKQRSLERLREIASFERSLTDGSASRFSGEYLLSLLHWKDSWRALEHIVSKLLNADGWETQLTSGGADGGVDVRGRRSTSSDEIESLVAQVKHQRQAVSVKVVRETRGVASNEDVTHALVATSGSFNRHALDFHNKNRGSDLVFDLWDRKDLTKRIDNLTEEQFMEMIRGFESQLLESARQQAAQSRVEIENKTELKLDSLIQDSLSIDVESPEAGTAKSHPGCELCGASMEHVQVTRWSRGYWRCPLHKSNRRYASV